MTKFAAPRLPDWERRLAAFLDANRGRVFEWGTWDCTVFSAGAVEAMTGENPALEFAGKYADETGAKEALRTLGAGTLLKTLDGKFERKPVGFAQRGDLVMFSRSVGIVMGRYALSVGEERLLEATGVVLNVGLVSVPRAAWEKAWAV